MSDLVSIIIPCHNAAPWLGETLASAFAQTWPRTELILVNDGSTDRSLEIARAFESRGLRIVDQPKSGASSARNAGLRAARGTFIQFLDADDLISPDKISAQMAQLSEAPSGCLSSCAWGRFQTDPAQALFVDQPVFQSFPALQFLILSGETGAMMHPSAWLVPRAVAEKAGPWDESLSLNDDGEYFCRVILASAGIQFCADTVARSYYRSGLSGSLSQQRNDRARRSQYASLDSITRLLLATEDSARVRRACAGHWRRFVHDFYPAPPELIARAESHLRQLGEPLGRPPMGPKTAAAAAILGWRLVWRLKYWLNR